MTATASMATGHGVLSDVHDNDVYGPPRPPGVRSEAPPQTRGGMTNSAKNRIMCCLMYATDCDMMRYRRRPSA